MFDHAAAPRPVSGFFLCFHAFIEQVNLNVLPVFFVSPTDPVTGKADFVVALLFSFTFFLSNSQQAHKASDISQKCKYYHFFFHRTRLNTATALFGYNSVLKKKNSPVMQRIMGDFLFVLLST